MSIQQKCRVEGCGNKGNPDSNGRRYFPKGYCMKHYQRMRIKGKLTLDSREPEQHGLANHPLYNTWAGMRYRCNNPNDRGYKYYGQRGIKVCDRWDKSFDNFLKDMGDKPSPEYSLDRIDNDGNYEPSNCRWATWSEQNKNRRMLRKTSSVYTGVSFHKPTLKWRSFITINGSFVSLGLYDTEYEAHLARTRAE